RERTGRAAARALARRPRPAARRRGVGGRRLQGAAGVRRPRAVVREEPARPRAADLPPREERRREDVAPRDAGARARRPGARPSARRGRVPLALRDPLRLARPPRPSVRAALGRRGVPPGVRAGREPDVGLRRQLELARPHLAAAEPPARAGAAPLRPLL